MMRTLLAVLVLVGVLALFVAPTVHAAENENTFMNPIITGDWWTAITSVYAGVIGSAFWAIMILLPAGMLYIKSRNTWPPTVILIVGSAVFGTLFDSIVFRAVMILFIAFGVGIVLYKSFSKGSGY